jgi:hypothetical protein
MVSGGFSSAQKWPMPVENGPFLKHFIRCNITVNALKINRFRDEFRTAKMDEYPSLCGWNSHIGRGVLCMLFVLKNHNLCATITSLIIVALLLMVGATILEVQLDRLLGGPVIRKALQNWVFVRGLHQGTN